MAIRDTIIGGHICTSERSASQHPTEELWPGHFRSAFKKKGCFLKAIASSSPCRDLRDLRGSPGKSPGKPATPWYADESPPRSCPSHHPDLIEVGVGAVRSQCGRTLVSRPHATLRARRSAARRILTRSSTARIRARTLLPDVGQHCP